jgi:hypothetical protein
VSVKKLVLGVGAHRSRVVTLGSSGAENTITHMFHALWLGSRWAWMLPNTDVRQ